MPTPAAKVLILDAMGVIYRVGDDVADLLVPFIHQNGGVHNIEQIEAAYIQASLGKINAAKFWQLVGISPALEDEYLSTLQLSDGLPQFLDAAKAQFDRVVCLSNDLSEWSRKLRSKFGLERYLTGWYISGDLGFRKPDPQIYRLILDDLSVAPAESLFVDDRIKNLNAAAELGMQTVYYDPGEPGGCSGHKSVSRLMAILGK
jgi:HAD superfamily hydrolase (TIGR01509 family)